MGTNKRESEGFREGAALFKALAHPVRLQIVALLRYGEACVCHMQTILGKRQPYISQQLMALRDAGLVEDRREGTIVYYRLAATEIETLLAWVRDELARQGRPTPQLVIPRPPVKGCPCPQCAQERTKLAE